MKLIQHLVADRRGIAALETAIILPVFLMLMFAATDLVVAIRTWHRLDTAAAQLGQIVSRCTTIDDPQDISVFMNDAQIIASPTDLTSGTGGTVIISAMANNSSGNTVILWQKSQGSAVFSSTFGGVGAVANVGSYTLPDDDVLIGVEIFAKPGLWQFSSGWMGKLQPTLYSQSMVLSRATDISTIETLQATTAATGACTGS